MLMSAASFEMQGTMGQERRTGPRRPLETSTATLGLGGGVHGKLHFTAANA